MLLQYILHQFQYFITTYLCKVEIYQQVFQSNSFNGEDLMVLFNWGWPRLINNLFFFFFFYLGFLSRTFTIHKTAGEGGGYLFFNPFLPLPSASQTHRHQSGDYCRELPFDSNLEPLVSRRKSLTTKLRALNENSNGSGSLVINQTFQKSILHSALISVVKKLFACVMF